MAKEKLIQTSHTCKEVLIQKNNHPEEVIKEILAEETPVAHCLQWSISCCNDG